MSAISSTLTRRCARDARLWLTVAEPEKFGPWDLTDDSLDYLIARIEFQESHARATANDLYELRFAREERGRRNALARFWGAGPHGTDSYDEYARLENTPSYWLAMQMDWAAHLLDRLHCLVRKGEVCEHGNEA